MTIKNDKPITINLTCDDVPCGLSMRANGATLTHPDLTTLVIVAQNDSGQFFGTAYTRGARVPSRLDFAAFPDVHKAAGFALSFLGERADKVAAESA